MAAYVLRREQFLPISISEAWAFFSAPRNLALITPPDMGFRIKEPFDDRAAYTGQCITYTVRPLLGIPLTWVSRITSVEEPICFVDTQLHGPYERWWHEHTFSEVENGVLIRDRVEYELPLGVLGDLAHAIFVKRRLNHIFDHRTRTLERLFGERDVAGNDKPSG